MKGDTDIGLELIKTILQIGKPDYIIDKAIEKAIRSKDSKLASKLNTAKFYISNGYPLVDAFYFSELLDDETYRYLNAVSSKSTLEANFIQDYLDEYRERKALLKQMLSLFVLPIVYVIMASIMGVIITTQFMNVIKNTVKPSDLPSWASIHLFISKHPFISVLLMIVISLVIVFSLLVLVLKHTGYKEMKLYSLASIVSSLRRQRIPYSDIFRMLATQEKDKNLKNLYYYVAEEVERNKISDALLPFYEMLPLTTTLVFQNLLDKGAETEAWQFLKKEEKEKFKNKIDTIKNISPMLGYIIVALIIIFSLLPLLIAIQSLIKNLSI